MNHSPSSLLTQEDLPQPISLHLADLGASPLLCLQKGKSTIRGHLGSLITLHDVLIAPPLTVVNIISLHAAHKLCPNLQFHASSVAATLSLPTAKGPKTILLCPKRHGLYITSTSKNPPSSPCNPLPSVIMMVTQQNLKHICYNDDAAARCTVPHDTASSTRSLPDLVPAIGEDDMPDLVQSIVPSLI